MQREGGFTLVEMAISLLIIGLLTGGVLLGQDLIRNSNLQVVIASEAKYAAAVKTFTEKYYALPGDMPNAVTFWARADDGSYAGDCAAPATDVGTGTQTCNGDGSGKIDDATNEMFRFWQHLLNAELIEGKFTGIHAGTVSLHEGGKNSPKTDILNATWGARYSDFTASATEFQVLWHNYLSFGIPNAVDGFPDGNALTPPEAASIDAKIDDGKPGSGKVMVVGGYATCTDAANSADFTSDYLATDAPLCALGFKAGF